MSIYRELATETMDHPYNRVYEAVRRKEKKFSILGGGVGSSPIVL